MPVPNQDMTVVILSFDTTLVIDTEFGTESAFGFLSTPFLPISLLMMALLIITSPVVQTAVPVVVPVVVPVIVPTPVPTTQTATQTATQTTIVPCVPTSCPEGYIISNDLTASTNCYFFSGDDEQSWSNALNICRMKGAYLWAPNTLAEANAVRSTTGFGQDVSIWIGAYSPTSDENFVFVVDGGAFTLDTLPFGESDPIDNDDCVEFEFAPNNNWNWDDDPCDRAQRYMCEFPRAETCT
ncbi:alpha-N-acetylgalactosamine-specific lectin-like [Mytilus trossulus]|uniref:alpha-N-acetylgalactosamine-specific lectin-like n=1 Tax=Mytilus trossulus TaxID=6551 RepID=UPI003005BFB5